FPLPTQFSNVNQLLPLSTMGKGGPLLSDTLFTQTLFATRSNNPGLYSAWHIVAARLDPCFPDLALLTSDPSKCRRQLRLIAQSMSGNGPSDSAPGVLNVDDAALHLFYEFNEFDFRALAYDWLALRTVESTSAAQPLGIHPTVASEGLTGPTYQEFTKLIKKYAGEGALTQLTAMEGRTVAWEFAGYKRNGATLTPLPIHGLPASTVAQTIGADNIGIFSITPETNESRKLAPLAGEFINNGGIGGGSVKLTASQADLNAALAFTLTVDDPTQQFNPDSLDCVSCHLAGRARERATMLGVDSSALPRFDNPRNLTLTGSQTPKDSPQQQRAFGYRDTAPSLTQRVVNESAAVADAMETLFPLLRD
ncbi:MAG TPA: hypothetical protein PLF40_19510, partial [Kofleriaceae bacterium]|nr:hypothetical protein [Kofleriaceae bacterium]